MSRLIGVVVMMGGVCLVQKVSAAVIVNSLNVPYSQDFNGLIRSGTATFVDDYTIAISILPAPAVALLGMCIVLGQPRVSTDRSVILDPAPTTISMRR
jgi:hypothetical protein